MKKGTITLLVIGVLILIMVGGTLTTYNGLIAKDEAVALHGATFNHNISAVPTSYLIW